MLHNPAWVVGLLIGCVTGSASGQDAPTTTRAVETQADRALRRMSAYLAEAKQFSFEAHDMVDELLETGQKIQFSSTRRIAVRRPDRIAAEIAGDLLQERVCYDGSMLTVWDVRQKVSGKIEVPDNIDDMLDHVAQRLGITMPLADLLFSDPYEAVIGQVRLGQYVGLHEVQGVKCHHLAFR